MKTNCYIESIVKRLVMTNYECQQYFNVTKTLYLLKTMDFTWFKGILVEIRLIFVMKIKVSILTIVERLVRIFSKCHQNLKEPLYFNVIRPYIHYNHGQYMV